METNLGKLTKTLYDEGLAKGREEGERLEREATERADKIIKEAEAKAGAIVQKAVGEAEELRTNTLSEVASAGRQAVAKIRGEIAEAIVAKAIGGGIHAAGLDVEFIKQILLEAARNWRGGKASLEVLLADGKKAELDGKFQKSAQELLAAGVEVGYSAAVKTGFRVSEKGGGYYVEFSDESFEALLGEYLRERAAKILYGGGSAAR